MPTISRRKVLAGATAAALGSAVRPLHAAKAAPITVVINQSPWFQGFRRVVDLYEKESGNKVELDVNPFGGLLDKQRNSVRSNQGLYDILILNSNWFSEMYFGGFLEPIADIDTGFKLDPGVFSCSDTVYFDAGAKRVGPGGKLMTMPINPNIPLLYYRSDLYAAKGLKVPETFEQLKDNAKALHNPPAMYGIVQRAIRGPASITYDFWPYLYGMGGAVFKDQPAGDYTVTLNSPTGKAALDYYISLIKDVGHPNSGAFDQAEVLQAMATGKTGHIIAVVAAWSQMDDKTKSVVVDKVEFAAPPHAPGLPSRPGLGHWLGGISRNVPDDRKRGALEFFRWFQTPAAQIAYAEGGGVPVHKAAFESPMSKERRGRWMKPMAEALPKAVHVYTFPDAHEMVQLLELGLNRAVVGELTTTAALNGMADQLHKLMSSRGYNTGMIEPLK